MNRRTFVWLSAVSAASIYIPASGCSSRYTVTNKALALPQFLAHICDAKTIRTIGAAYKQQVPDEKSDKKLAHLILTDNTGRAISESTDNNKLEALSGDRKGQHSIRINDQYRICFVWTESGPDQVEIVDYH